MQTNTQTHDTRVPVSTQALIARLRRHLAKLGRQFRITRSDRWLHELGRYYVLDDATSVLVDRHVDLEALAREIGALAVHERLVEDVVVSDRRIKVE